MAGYNLKEGKYLDKKLSEEDMWNVFMPLFTSTTKNDTSYKYGFLKAIIDNLYNIGDDYVLTFNKVFQTFTVIYWNLINKYSIRQKAPTKDGRESLLERVIKGLSSDYEISSDIPYENIPLEIREVIEKKVKQNCKTYVVGAVYSDTKQLFYSFSKKEEKIELNPQVYDFLCRHKSAIEKINYFEWAKFLEKVNDEDTTNKLISKIEHSSQRTNLSVYREILFNELETERCFYCGKKINMSNVEVDHFIPWSFVKDDKIWNLVLSCKECNRKKSDKLPDLKFMEKIEQRNINLENKMDDGEQHYSEFELYNEHTIRELYYWANLNGYSEIWKPSMKR